MITAIVQFDLPPGTSREDAAALYRLSAPRYQALEGLVRKYYLYGDDGRGGGVYLWTSREAAEAVYNGDWRQMIADRYGVEPEITYFHTPVVVDNASGEISSDEAA